MNPVTAHMLRELANGGDPAIEAALATEFEAQCAGYGVDTRLRLAHFLAQCCIETWWFKRLEENLSYGAPQIGRVWPRLAQRAHALQNNPHALGNAAYAGKNGNGDEASGDGWRYRGRGALDITGRANYREVGTLLGEDLEGNPDLVSQPKMAVATALAFWKHHNINAACDDDRGDIVTDLVAGSREALTDRLIVKNRALRLLGPQ